MKRSRSQLEDGGDQIQPTTINGTMVTECRWKKARCPPVEDLCTPVTASEVTSISDSNINNFQFFIQKFIEDRYSFKVDRSGNRFCVFFAHTLQQVTKISSKETTHFSPSYCHELSNVQLLLYKAIHSVNESFELFFDIARNAEFFILQLLPKHESIEFFEAMVNAAQRYSKRQYGIMLACLGSVLEVNHICVAETHDLFKKASDVLKPLGDSMELAWVYNHLGFMWFHKGFYREAER